MKYISIDTETTGLNDEKCQILSFGAIIEDTNNPLPFDEIPKLHLIIDRGQRGIIQGEPYALNMNKELIEKLAKQKSDDPLDIFCTENEVVPLFYNFLYQNGLIPEKDIEKAGGYVSIFDNEIRPILTNNTPKVHINVAGKNFSGFDLHFLKKLPKWEQVIQVRSRILDPAILYVDWDNDNTLPGLMLCKERAECDVLDVSHNAVEDAWDVIQLLRKFYIK